MQNITRKPFRFRTILPPGHICYSTGSGEDQASSGTLNDEVPVLSGLTGQRVVFSEVFRANLDILGAYTVRSCRDIELIVDVAVGALYLYDLVDCRIAFYAVQSSVNVADCRSISLSGFTSQMRITESETVRVNVQTNSATALVNCSEVSVGKPPEPDSHYRLALSRVPQFTEEYIRSDKWMTVNDFNSLNNSKSNWKFIEQ